ncbi:histidine phosphatase family protein [Sedimentibacter sp. zth1]|uniref:histidine phosphatase family protein n=1 Tax=Sedimentibacter sp. zth1 TaxID=2816908 RepID=UPI001A918A60|nr:histidine phosphatase family protein [Sedimentibacter sp. zth1]QSX05553.1 histidine phosphatase family protein [Sedimentibacter sp. zth1]
MITIYITRHGQTYWNIEKRLQGQGNSELTEKGILGAKLLCERFKDTDIDCIISSPLKRTMDTSEIVKGDKNIPIYTLDSLMEIDIGTFSGHTVDEMKLIDKKLVENILSNPYEVCYPEGENLLQFYDRCVKSIKEIIDNYDGKTVLVVAHGGVLNCIEHYMRQEIVPPNWEDQIVENCSLTKYEIDGENIKEILFNDIEHLRVSFAQ